MRVVYVVCAYLIAALVVVEVVTISLAGFEVRAQVNAGAVLGAGFDQGGMYLAHRVIGGYVLPPISLTFFISSFQTYRRGATLWSLLVCALVFLQSGIAFVAVESRPIAGAVHGLMAIGLLASAWHAGHRLRRAADDVRWDMDDFR